MSKKTLALIGEGADIKIINELENLGFDVFVLKKDERLPAPVASHADMLLFYADKKVFLSKGYAQANPELLDTLKNAGYSSVACDCRPENKYPHDVLFNIARVGRHIFANMKHIDTTVKKYLTEREYSLAHVNQGYTKCSTVVVSDSAIITADSGIASTASDCGIDVLLIENSQAAVRLEGYDYGFLGGACGLYNNTMYFCGNLSLHPDSKRISDFCLSRGVRVVSLSDDNLCDVGGIFFLM